MRRQRRPGDSATGTIGDAVASGAEPLPASPPVDSAFDLAQGLLDAALEEVRTSPSSTSPAFADPGRGTTTVEPRRRRARSSRSSRPSRPVAAPPAPDAAPVAIAVAPEAEPESSAPDEAPTIVMEAVEAVEAVDTRPRSQPAADAVAGRHRRTAVLAVAVLAVVAVGAVVAVLLAGGGSEEASPAASGTTTSIRRTFPVATTPEGAVVRRTWVLEGGRGDRFVGRLTFSNPTAAPVTVTHTETIPKSLAASVDEIRFDPEPRVLEDDPVVQYSLTLGPGERVTVRYAIAVAPTGVERARLDGWASDLPDTSSDPEGSSTTTTTASTTPTTSAPPTTAAPPVPPPPPIPPPPAPANAAIVVRVVSQGASGTFGFSGPGGSAALTTTGSQGVAQSAPVPVAAGVYSWTQVSAPPGSTLIGVGCSDGESGGSGPTATFRVQAGETVTCTWTNG